MDSVYGRHTHSCDGVDGLKSWAGIFALVLAGAVMLHGWPLSGRPALRFFWPANCVVLAWCALVIGWQWRGARWKGIARMWPPDCVWAYLAVCLLSVATADGLGRAVTVAAKMILCWVGTYTLVAMACRDRNRVRHLLLVVTGSASLVVAGAWLQRLAGLRPTGLFESPLKFGSFLAMTVPAGFVYLVGARWPLARLGVGILLFGALTVCGSIWAAVGMAVGAAAGGLCVGAGRGWAALCLSGALLGAVLWVLSGRHPELAADARLIEPGGTDLKQRYIEWQAQLNLLKDRAAVGTGAGCLNDYRGMYYGRLPKNNTIARFDQNGWLAAASETSLLGLACLCWIYGHFVTRAFRKRWDPAVRSAGAGVLAMAVAQAASSVFYNGILVVFVMLSAVIDHGAAGEGE